MPFCFLILWEEEEIRVEVSSEPRESHHVGLAAPGGPAGGQRVADEARGTGADGAVVPGLALGVLAAGVLAG